jgi:hypothetical protein
LSLLFFFGGAVQVLIKKRIEDKVGLSVRGLLSGRRQALVIAQAFAERPCELCADALARGADAPSRLEL